MKALVALAVVVALGGLWLWAEVRTPAATSAGTRNPTAAQPTVDRSAPGEPSAPRSARTSDPQPPGGVRAWSPTAAATDGPDPFAPVPQVRTLDETRAGLDP